jgi:hypothetical protein
MPCVMRRFPVTLTISLVACGTRGAIVVTTFQCALRMCWLLRRGRFVPVSPPPPGQVRNLAPIASLNINSLSSERPGRIRFEQHLTPRTCLAATQQF